VWGGGLAPYLAMWLAMGLFKIVVSEVDAFLEWMPQQSELKSGTCTTKNKI